MSQRAEISSTDDYGRVHVFELWEDGYSGGVEDLKNTGQGYGSKEYQKIDPRNPWENPIQKVALEISAWLTWSQRGLIDDIKTADERTFWIIHKIDGTTEWSGYVYGDLCTYEEGFDGHPFRITLLAKDFTDLKGKDFVQSGSLPDSREVVLDTIAWLLDQIGFSAPIKTHTSWIESHITSSDDYLRQIYHETRALRKFGSEGEEDQSITMFAALEKLLSNHKLILKQSGGAYWIDQLSAFGDPTSVLQAEYNLSGALQSEGNTDRTVSANTADLKVVIQEDNRDNSGLPGLWRASVRFEHRSQISALTLPGSIYFEGDENQSFQKVFVSTGDQSITLSSNIRVIDSEDLSGGELEVMIRVGQYYWNGSSWTTDSSARVVVTLTALGVQDTEGNWIYRGSLSESTLTIPGDALSPMEAEFFSGTVGDPPQVADFTEFNPIQFSVDNPNNSTRAIDFTLTRDSGSYTETFDGGADWYGDGPGPDAPSALRYSDQDSATTSNSWGRRGGTADRNFHENYLKEPMDAQRGWRRLLTALMKGTYHAHEVLSYDSEHLYFLGGSQDIFTGNWTGEMFRLDIETGSDTFATAERFSGTGGTAGGSGGGGAITPTWEDVLEKPFEEVKTDGGHFVISQNELQLPQRLDNEADVNFKSGTFTAGVTAYEGGTGADQGGGTYQVDQLNTTPSTGNIAVDSNDLFGATPTGTFRKIDSAWIDGDVGGGSFEDITGSPYDNTNLAAALNLKAPLDSPNFTGTPSWASETLATRQWVQDNTSAGTFVPASGGTFTGKVISEGGFAAENTSGTWFDARVTNNSDSEIFRGKDSAGNRVGQIITTNFDGAGGGYLDLWGEWRLNGNSIVVPSGDYTITGTWIFNSNGQTARFEHDGSRDLFTIQHNGARTVGLAARNNNQAFFEDADRNPILGLYQDQSVSVGTHINFGESGTGYQKRITTNSAIGGTATVEFQTSHDGSNSGLNTLLLLRGGSSPDIEFYRGGVNNGNETEVLRYDHSVNAWVSSVNFSVNATIRQGGVPVATQNWVDGELSSVPRLGEDTTFQDNLRVIHSKDNPIVFEFRNNTTGGAYLQLLGYDGGDIVFRPENTSSFDFFWDASANQWKFDTGISVGGGASFTSGITISAGDVDAQNGDIYGDNFIENSDVSKKDVFGYVDGAFALEGVRRLGAIDFSHHGKGRRQYGYSAQDVREFFPLAVQQGDDDLLNILPTSLVALNSAAIGELANRTESRMEYLERRVDELESEVETLRAA